MTRCNLSRATDDMKRRVKVQIGVERSFASEGRTNKSTARHAKQKAVKQDNNKPADKHQQLPVPEGRSRYPALKDDVI